MSAKNNFAAFLTGAAVGAVVALLFAPEKGEVTRRKIRRAVEDGYGRAADVFEEGREALREGYARGRARAKGVVEDRREKLANIVADGRERLADAIAEGREFVEAEKRIVRRPVKKIAKTQTKTKAPK